MLVVTVPVGLEGRNHLYGRRGRSDPLVYIGLMTTDSSSSGLSIPAFIWATLIERTSSPNSSSNSAIALRILSASVFLPI